MHRPSAAPPPSCALQTTSSELAAILPTSTSTTGSGSPYKSLSRVRRRPSTVAITRTWLLAGCVGGGAGAACLGVLAGVLEAPPRRTGLAAARARKRSRTALTMDRQIRKS